MNNLQQNSNKNMPTFDQDIHLVMLCATCQPFCSDLDVTQFIEVGCSIAESMNQVIVGLDYGLSPIPCQAVNFSDISIDIPNISLKKI